MNEAHKTTHLQKKELAILQRQELIQKIGQMNPKNLLDRLSNYKDRMAENNLLDKIARRSVFDLEEIHHYHQAEVNNYPGMDLEEEAVMGRIIEIARNKKGSWDTFAREAEDYLIGSKLGWLAIMANKFYGFTSNSLSTNDLSQVGSETLVKILPEWRWQEGALSTFAYFRVRNSMSDEIAANRGKSKLLDSRIKDIKDAIDLWKEIKGDKPSNKQLAQAMVLYYLQPDLKLSENEDRLRKILIELGTSLKILNKDPSKISTSTLIDTVEERLDVYEEIDIRSGTVEGNSPIDSAEDAEELFDLIGVEMDRSHLAPEKIVEFERLVEELIKKLTPRQKDMIRFMLLGEKRTPKELAFHSGMDEKNAKNSYQRALKRARNNHMAALNLKNFLKNEDYL